MNASADQIGHSHVTHGGLVGVPLVFATFQRQKLTDPKTLQCIDFGAALKIDVTDVVLSKSAQELRSILDNHASSDALVPYGRHFHDGVYRVEISESIKSHFGVSDLKEISQTMVDGAFQAFQDHQKIQRAMQAQASIPKDPAAGKRFSLNGSMAGAI